MHVRQPMQVCWFTSTTPSAFLKVAPTGHTLRQGGFSQCMHSRGMGCVSPSADEMRYTLIHFWSFARWCSSWQALVQCSQPSHLRRSTTKAHWCLASGAAEVAATRRSPTNGADAVPPAARVSAVRKRLRVSATRDLAIAWKLLVVGLLHTSGDHVALPAMNDRSTGYKGSENIAGRVGAVGCRR